MKQQNNISHIKFIFLYTLFVYISSNIINYEKFTKWFYTKDIFDTTGFIAYIIVGFGLSLALIIILSHRYTTKPLAIFTLFASAFSTYFISKFGVAIDTTMLENVIHTNTTESLTLFSANIIPYILFLAVIPSYFVLKTNIVYDNFLKHTIKSILFLSLTIAVTLFFVYIKFNSLHLAGNRSGKYIAYQLIPLNFLSAILRETKYYIKKNYIAPPKPIIIEATRQKDKDLVVVLAVGESARQQNFTLYGYKRDTNPLLMKQKDLHILNGIAKYGSTIWALPQILSRNDIKLPSITNKVDINSSCIVNFQMYGNCGVIKEQPVKQCSHNNKCYDEDVIPMLQKELDQYKNGSKFTVLHIGAGSHGPLYNTRYPKEFQKFNPQCLSADVMNNCTKQELYNSYDNTILYTDYVVSNIIDTLEKSKVPYIFIYVSDHGESLLEDGRVFHGMPPGIDLPYEQAHIPLLVKASVPIKIIKKDQYTQQDIYDTILGLFDIDTDIIKKENIFIKIKD